MHIVNNFLLSGDLVIMRGEIFLTACTDMVLNNENLMFHLVSSIAPFIGQQLTGS